jgi:NUMOD3 motif
MPAAKPIPKNFADSISSYIAQEISTSDMAVRHGVAKATVLKWMDLVGVDRHPVSVMLSKKMAGKKSRLGTKHTDETKAKMSAARAGVQMLHRRGEIRSEAARQKMRDAWDRRLGADRVRSPKPVAKPKTTTLTLPLQGIEPKKAKRTKEEYQAIARARSACKRMLRRVLVMTRIRKDRSTETLLGYDKHELRAHLEAQFRPGMSWAARESFHIDHIRPVADFLRNGITCPSIINALSNLQVLTPEENRKKSDSYEGSFADKPRHHALVIDRNGTRPLFA